MLSAAEAISPHLVTRQGDPSHVWADCEYGPNPDICASTCCCVVRANQSASADGRLDGLHWACGVGLRLAAA